LRNYFDEATILKLARDKGYSTALDGKKLVGVLFLDLYCAFHSASHVVTQASGGLSESCP
jgi:hypothetical protein